MEETHSTIHGLIADYTCEKCGASQKVNIFPCINFSQNPEYYPLVRDLSVFRVKCEKCGAERVIQFDTLLIDEEHKYFLYLLSDKALYNRFKYQITYFIETVLNKDDKYDLSQFRTRLVYSPNDLIEKMSIFECGLDDEVIEILKCSMFDKGVVDRAVYDCLHFDGMTGADLGFVAFSSKTSTKEPVKLIIRFPFYNKVIDDLANFRNRHRDYFEVIDEEWVRSKFDRPLGKSSVEQGK